MAHLPVHLHHDYGMSNVSDYATEPFLHEEVSTSSSPSPIMWQLSDQYMHPPQDVQFEAFREQLGFPYFDALHPAPIVEFTDLTAPYSEDRRRKRTQVKDKQAISSMHMRRRAQNRASQRAFRERKERHAQDLQHQLDKLEAKHKALEASHQELGNTNKKLVDELDTLKIKIQAIQATQDAVEETLSLEIPESSGEGPSMERDGSLQS